MAKVKDNVMTRGFSGTVARLLTFRQKAGATIVSKLRRPSTGEPSEKATAVMAKFALSIKYAKAAIKNPATKALYKAMAKDGQTAFNVAMADAFIAPTVESIDATGYHGIVGDPLTIRATDNFKVAGVTVSIHNATGDLVEQGKAIVQEDTVDWLYTATQVNPAIAGSKITAVATDLPGNSTPFEVIL
ncbi:MAG TPA: hypothetical protein VK543_00760 [Puia sp.]|nr:hypothetical protein [Puia sp.]